jgi:hypothetical protein
VVANAEVKTRPEIRPANPGELAGLTRFAVYIDHAAFLMSAAFAAADVRDFAPARRRQTIRPAGDSTRWYSEVAGDVLTRLSEIRHSLVHHWTPSPDADAFVMEAVELLAELTPVRDQIVALCRSNRSAGLAELARHLEIVDRQYLLAAGLIGRQEAGEGGQPSDRATAGFTAARQALLETAGGAMSLTEAANALSVSRQNLHKRIHAGSALGMMLDERILVPRLQLASIDGKVAIIGGIERVVRPFLESKAGAWSALQFLVDHDPNLGKPPIDALRAGNVASVEHAARAYLGLDEG